MSAVTMSDAAAAYLASVDAQLADLPPDERAELLEDLALHLQAVEEEGKGISLNARLGSAQDYAAELRTAAGLPPRGRRKVSATTSAAPAIAWAREKYASSGLPEFLTQLRPGWWVLRGYLVVVVVCILEHGMGVVGDGPGFRISSTRRDMPLPAPLGSHLLGLLLVLAAVMASVKIGRTRLQSPLGAIVVAGNLVLLTAVMLLAGTAHLVPSQCGTFTVNSWSGAKGAPLTAFLWE